MCENKPNGDYQHPSKCSKFVKCSNGMESVMECPGDLVFNPTTDQCDYKENTMCQVWNAVVGNWKLFYFCFSKCLIWRKSNARVQLSISSIINWLQSDTIFTVWEWFDCLFPEGNCTPPVSVSKTQSRSTYLLCPPSSPPPSGNRCFSIDWLIDWLIYIVGTCCWKSWISSQRQKPSCHSFGFEQVPWWHEDHTSQVGACLWFCNMCCWCHSKLLGM